MNDRLLVKAEQISGYRHGEVLFIDRKEELALHCSPCYVVLCYGCDQRSSANRVYYF